MNATNRILNRVLLLIGGVLLAAVGLGAVLGTVRPRWAASLLDDATATAEAIAQSADRTVEIAGLGPAPLALLIGVAAAVVLTVLLVAFLWTRGGGRRHEVLEITSDTGRTTVDHGVAAAFLTEPLAARPDVLSARAGVYGVKGRPAIDLVVTLRRGADPARIAAAAERVVADWDSLAGRRVPVLVHLADRGWLDGFRSAVHVR